MSRVGNRPITIPRGVTIQKESRQLTINGPKGLLHIVVPFRVDVVVSDDDILVSRHGNSRDVRAIHGTTRSHIANAVSGVLSGWEKELELIGVGYRAKSSGNDLTLSVGFSHPVTIAAPDGIGFKVTGNKITVHGIDKHLVGEIAAQIRKVRPPEPYKGKGIRYKGEVVRKKAGKAAKAVGA